jgi:hypothetical protein
VFSYGSSVANATFLLNTAPMPQPQAQRFCQAAGGHLAAYLRAAEQAEVEGHFLGAGHLLPTYHRSYWLGLVTPTLRPARFRWAAGRRPPLI